MLPYERMARTVFRAATDRRTELLAFHAMLLAPVRLKLRRPYAVAAVTAHETVPQGTILDAVRRRQHARARMQRKDTQRNGRRARSGKRWAKSSQRDIVWRGIRTCCCMRRSKSDCLRNSIIMQRRAVRRCNWCIDKKNGQSRSCANLKSVRAIGKNDPRVGMKMIPGSVFVRPCKIAKPNVRR